MLYTSPSATSWASRIVGAHMTTRWDRISNAKGSLTEQTRRERNGARHRETMSINAEIAGDAGHRKRSKTLSIDKVRINGAIFVNRYITKCEKLRESFGPRLVRPDGTAIYTFQKK